MQADLPHTLYFPRDHKGKKKNQKDYNPNPKDKALELQEEANRKANERRKAKAEGKTTYTTQELFSK